MPGQHLEDAWHAYATTELTPGKTTDRMTSGTEFIGLMIAIE